MIQQLDEINRQLGNKIRESTSISCVCCIIVRFYLEYVSNSGSLVLMGAIAI